jgi:hypothetical protein
MEKKYISFHRFLHEQNKVRGRIRATMSGKSFIEIRLKDKPYYDYAYFSKFCKVIPEQGTTIDMEKYCLLNMGDYFLVVEMNKYGYADRALVYLDITKNPNVHLHSKEGTYIVCSYNDKIFKITCKKWIAEWKRGDRLCPVWIYSLHHFKCLTGDLTQYDVHFNQRNIIPEVKRFL